MHCHRVRPSHGALFALACVTSAVLARFAPACAAPQEQDPAVLGSPEAAPATPPGAPIQRVTIRGRALTAEGRPFAGATVAVADIDEFVDIATQLSEAATTTDAAGEYSLEIDRPTGSSWVLVAAPGFQSCALRLDVQQAEDVVLMAEAPMLPGSRLLGRVKNDANQPLAGATITVRSGLPPDPGAEVVLLSGARSDARGIFSVPCVPRTGLRVTVRHLGHEPFESLASQQSALQIELRATGVAEGRVLDHAGEPVAGVSVYAMTLWSDHQVETFTTDNDGCFAVTVPGESPYLLRATGSGPHSRTFVAAPRVGPCAGVELRPTGQAVAGSLSIRVLGPDAEPVPEFYASIDLWGGEQSLNSAFAWHGTRRQRFDNPSVVPLPGTRLSGLGQVVVDAPGLAWEAAPLPEDLDRVLEVALQPEAVLSGTVRDQASGQPYPGAVVRAVPAGRAAGGGGDPRRGGATTDQRGRYEIRGLREGSYHVQVYAAGRPSSRVFDARVARDGTAPCDLSVPAPRLVEFVTDLSVPEGLPARLSIRELQRLEPGFLEFRSDPAPRPLSLVAEREYRIGPFGRDELAGRLWLPSRVRLGAGLGVPIDQLPVRTGPVGAQDDAPVARLALDDLRRQVVRGVVVLPESVPHERVGVLVSSAAEGESFLARVMSRPAFAAIGPDRTFALDLPAGDYYVQLVDLVTGIAFHTEPDPVALAATSRPLELRPEIRWLEIEMSPAKGWATIELSAYQVELARPNGGACPAVMKAWSRSAERERGEVPFVPGRAIARWLVPKGPITVRALQAWDKLRHGGEGWSNETAASSTLEVSDELHRLEWQIPGPPLDLVLETARAP